MNESILFAEWVAENHYRLINIKSNGLRQWGTDDFKPIKTTQELFEEYQKELKTK